MMKKKLLASKYLVNTSFSLLGTKDRPYTFFVVLAFFLASCASAQTPSLPTFTPLPATPTQTETPSTFTLTVEPSPTVTNNPTAMPIPCSPIFEFCVEDGHFLLARPISAEYENTIHGGYRYGTTINGEREPHHGVEFINASGTPVLASADGEVIFAGYDKSLDYNPWLDFYGNLVVVAHDFNVWDESVYTFYAHLSQIDVEMGQKVTLGEKLGDVGWTGAAIGSHLHFEVRVGGLNYTDTRNPELWLMPLEVEQGAIVARVADRNGKLIRVPMTVQKVEGADSALESVASLSAYAPETHPVGVDEHWQENYAIAGLDAGQYRLTIVTAGKVYERFVYVRPVQVTVAYFIIE